MAANKKNGGVGIQLEYWCAADIFACLSLRVTVTLEEFAMAGSCPTLLCTGHE